MKPVLVLLTIAILSILIAVTRPHLSDNPTSVAEIESYINQLVAKDLPPGLSVAVVKDGQMVYSQAFGLADGPAELPATTDTVYHWWSMTKLPTALAVLQLHDAGQLNIDDPVSEYLSFFQVELEGAPAPPITIRQLLRHTSGLPDTVPAMIGWIHTEDKIYNQTALLKQHLPDYNQLKFAPDTDSAYTNLGYMVLGAIIEAVSGQSYEDYIQSHILAPLDMNETDFLYTAQMAGQIAAGSHPLGSIYTPLLPFILDTDTLFSQRIGARYWLNKVYIDATPSSGLLGSVNDVAQLTQALLAQTDLLTPESYALMLPQGDTPTERPLGWAEFNTGDRLWLQHRGGGPGFATILRLYPKENLGIVIMANSTNLPAEKLANAFASLDW